MSILMTHTTKADEIVGSETAVHDPDAETLDAFLRGETEAAGRLYARHRARVTGLARLLLGDGRDAEDICHEAFLRALSSLPRFRREVPLRLVAEPHRGQPVPEQTRAPVRSRRGRRSSGTTARAAGRARRPRGGSRGGPISS